MTSFCRFGASSQVRRGLTTTLLPLEPLLVAAGTSDERLVARRFGMLKHAACADGADSEGRLWSIFIRSMCSMPVGVRSPMIDGACMWCCGCRCVAGVVFCLLPPSEETSTKGVADVVSGHGRAPVARLRVGPRFLRSASRLVSRYANVTRAYTQRSFRTRAPRSAHKMLHTVGCTVRREVTGLVPCVDRNDRLERRRTSAR